MSRTVATTKEMVEKVYQSIQTKTASLKQQLGRPLTLTEKVLFSHLADPSAAANIKRGKSFVMLNPDRVAMQDATAQMAILQFMQSGRDQAAVPSTVHCDHLIRAYKGNDHDMKVAEHENNEVYKFLKSSSAKYGFGFWGPGAGIIHQVVIENYAFPGGMMIGTDSHTPNAGGLGMIAIGVGGADAVDVMAGMEWELLYPEIVGVHLKGSLHGWTAPKDVILKVLDMLSVKGGTNRIMEYFGEGARSISCTGKGTITNMGAELGATTSIFPYDKKMFDYLTMTGRTDIAKLADQYSECLMADKEVEQNPEKFYDKVIEIDLDALAPHVVGPHSPDLAREIGAFKEEIDKEKYPEKITACLIGSCTNSSYEDIGRATSVVRQAAKKGLKAKTKFMITPGSEQIYNTIKRDGFLDDLVDFGGVVLANACGPCIGQWQRDDIKKGDSNSIVSSFNRNFRGRNDANPDTLSFISSPEIVVAYALSGSLKFNPITDTLKAADGSEVKLDVPTGDELPSQGFVEGLSGYVEPPESGEGVEVIVNDDSERLAILQPFGPRPKKDIVDQLLLVKTLGKTTTDHISPAGKWLKFRGHLDRISDNMLTGATNAFYDEIGFGVNALEGGKGEPLPKVARDYKKAGHSWVVVGDENYGEGSSREHAAMSPRFLGCSCVIVKSFARIHETNLKKQGVLALTFSNPADYEKVRVDDKISVLGMEGFKPGVPLSVKLSHADGSSDTIEVNHSYNKEQIDWYWAGSALNKIKETISSK